LSTPPRRLSSLLDWRAAVKPLVAVLGAYSTGLGLWAFAMPRSFFDQVAIYPPYSVHLVHDLGAFLTGLGISLLLSLRWPALLPGALAANLVAAVLHTASHLEDLGRGGHVYDLPAVALLMLLTGAAAFLARRRRVP
jgi:hypothetical protein